MADQSVMSRLSQFFNRRPAPIGSGMAAMAQRDVQMHPDYQRHVMEQQSMGQPAMSYEEYLKMMRQQQMQQGAPEQDAPVQPPPFRF